MEHDDEFLKDRERHATAFSATARAARIEHRHRTERRALDAKRLRQADAQMPLAPAELQRRLALLADVSVRQSSGGSHGQSTES